MKPEKPWQQVGNGDALSKASPPSCIIIDVCTQEKVIPSEDTIQEIARNVQLPVAEVVIWLEHLPQIHVSRKKGGEKGARTRKDKKSKGSRQRKTNPGSLMSEELCLTCPQGDPSNDSVDLANWISCDECYSWHHLV